MVVNRRGAIPRSMPSSGAVVWADLTDSAGAGRIIEPRRCALMTKWHSGFAGLKHAANRTEIGFLRPVRLEPGDTVLATFALIPHGAEGGIAETPTIVPGTWRAVQRQ